MPSRILQPGTGEPWSTWPGILARWRTDQGLTDIGPNNTWGPLVATGGAVATGSDADGNPCWQFRAASGGWLVANPSPSVALQNPVQLLVIAKAGPAPANNQTWVCSAAGGSFFFYNNSAHMAISPGAATFLATPANPNVYNVYMHNQATRASVGNAAYQITGNAGGQSIGLVNGISFGAQVGGVGKSDLDCSELIVCEGPIPDFVLQGFTFYARARYPSFGLAAAIPAAFSVNQTSLGGLVAPPFDVVPIGGQSNNKTFAITGPVTVPGANTFELLSDNTVSPLLTLYQGNATNLDRVNNADNLAGKIGGNATALANSYVASSGRPLLVVPCAEGGSYMGGSPPSSQLWAPSYPHNQQFRNSLFGSMVQRTLSMLALGGTFRFLWWYQGESEVLVGSGGVVDSPAQHAALTDDFLTKFFQAIGQPKRVILQTIANTCGTATPSNIAILQAGQASLAAAGSVLVMPASSGPYEADNLHLTGPAQTVLGNQAAAAAIAQGAPWI